MLSGEALIAVVNPRRRRDSKGRFLKRGHGGGRRARSNPKRRRSHAKRHHARSAPRRRAYYGRRRRAHRNPRFAIPSTSSITRTLGGAMVGAGGALGLDLALAFGASYLPAAVAVPGWPRNLLRLAGAFGIGALSGLVVKPETARAITAGAVTVVTYSIVKELANQYVLPATMQLGEESAPWAWNPYLSRLGHGGSASSGTVDGYITGGRVRSFNMPRVRAGAGATAGRSRGMSAFIEDGVTSPGGSGLGADIEI